MMLSQTDSHLKLAMYRYGLGAIPMTKLTPVTPILEYLLAILDLRSLKRIHGALEDAFLAAAEGMNKNKMEYIEEQLETVAAALATDNDEFVRTIVNRLFPKWPECYAVFLKSITRELETLLLREKRKIDRNRKTSAWALRLQTLRKTFNLSAKEAELLVFFYVLSHYDFAGNAFRSAPLKMDEMRTSIKTYCRFFGLKPAELKTLLGKKSTLVRAGFIERNRHGGIGLADHFADYLAGLGDLDLTSSYFELDKNPSEVDTSDFHLNPSLLNTIATLLKSSRPVNILFHGAPGSGKTELSRSLSHALKKDLYFVRQTDADGDEDLDHRKTSLVASQTLLKGKNCILVVDECDPIINTSPALFACEKVTDDNKSWINQFLETNKVTTIWISNRSSSIDESTKRRFSLTHEFLQPEPKQRLKAWRLQVQKQKADFISEELLQDFARTYRLGPGSISLAIRDVMASVESRKPDERITALKAILDQQQYFIFGKAQPLNQITNRYDLTGLNTDVPLEKVRDAMTAFWQLSESRRAQIPNLNVLLMGPPGAGKTEFAKYLSDSTGKELLVKRTSDLIGPYVGQSEQNIARAFRSAEQGDSILFLDEADSLFIDRASAERSWEVNQTNELLCQMENFRGALICATNFAENLDQAVLRRFAYKVRFDFLRADDNVRFFERVLGPIAADNPSEPEADAIRALKCLTPGDFKTVLQQFTFESEKVPVTLLIEKLAAEVVMKAQGPRRLGILS